MFFFLTFIVSMAIWIVFSGNLDVFHLTLGAIASAIVAFFSSDLLFQNRKKSLGARFATMFGAVSYGIWLLYQIILANLSVIYLALHPRSRELIDPQIIKFKTELESDFAKVILANSITLTPGTVTVKIIDDEFQVHALSRKLAEGCPGDMEKRVKKVFDR